MKTQGARGHTPGCDSRPRAVRRGSLVHAPRAVFVAAPPSVHLLTPRGAAGRGPFPAGQLWALGLGDTPARGGALPIYTALSGGSSPTSRDREQGRRACVRPPGGDWRGCGGHANTSRAALLRTTFSPQTELGVLGLQPDKARAEDRRARGPHGAAAGAEWAGRGPGP